MAIQLATQCCIPQPVVHTVRGPDHIGNDMAYNSTNSNEMKSNKCAIYLQKKSQIISKVKSANISFSTLTIVFVCTRDLFKLEIIT